MNKILVWDLPLRLFHWLVALLAVVSVASGNIGGNAMQLHTLSGYTILALVLFRIAWGYVGGTHARFASFVRGPAAVIAYLRTLPRRDAERYLGHNPAGAYSVVLMLAALLVQAATGLFANDDIATEGPLAKFVSKAVSDRITGIHDANAVLLYALIGLHVAAVAYYAAYKRDNLVKPMLTGFKDPVAAPGEVEHNEGRNWLAALLFAACAGGVYLLVRLAAA